MRPVDPAVAFMLILLIGVVTGLVFERAVRPGWFSRELANERRGMITLALVGIAGSFIGYHLTLLFGLFRIGALAPFAGALIAAIAVCWLWRLVR